MANIGPIVRTESTRVTQPNRQSVQQLNTDSDKV